MAIDRIPLPRDPYLPKQRRWNPRKAAENLFTALGVVFVLFVLPLLMFVSCTGR